MLLDCHPPDQVINKYFYLNSEDDLSNHIITDLLPSINRKSIIPIFSLTPNRIVPAMHDGGLVIADTLVISVVQIES